MTRAAVQKVHCTMQFVTSETITNHYVFFWKGIFSQWSATQFRIQGETFNSCEQWMMASKARLFGDEETRAASMATTSRRRQKNLGRQVQGFDQSLWDQVKFDLVVFGNYARSQEDEAFRQALLETEYLILVEANPMDSIWGVGFAADKALYHIVEWGENLLGLALVKVRTALQEPTKTTKTILPNQGTPAWVLLQKVFSLAK